MLDCTRTALRAKVQDFILVLHLVSCGHDLLELSHHCAIRLVAARVIGLATPALKMAKPPGGP